MKVYAIPGLGTNHLIFEQLKLNHHELVVLQWAPLKKEYSLAEYARCFASQIDVREPFIILGLSFGGMIAVELSKLVRPQKLILVSSAKCRAGLSWPIRFFKYFPVYLILPDTCLRWVAFHSRWILGFFIEYMPSLMTMINEMPVNYFKYSIHYIVNWNNSDIPPNCVLIHGTRDKLIWFKKRFVDYKIDGGTHAMIITKAAEVNKAIQSFLF